MQDKIQNYTLKFDCNNITIHQFANVFSYKITMDVRVILKDYLDYCHE